MLIAFIDKINPNLSNANPPARQCQEYRAEIADLDEFLRGNRTSLDHDLARGEGSGTIDRYRAHRG